MSDLTTADSTNEVTNSLKKNVNLNKIFNV